MNRNCDGKRKFVHAQNSVTKSLREHGGRELARIDNFKTRAERQAKGAAALIGRERPEPRDHNVRGALLK